jgi:cytoskeletal protein CcmA (bactofilin family)
MEGKKMKEWMTARNQKELAALLKRHGRALRVRVFGTWHGDFSVSRRALHSIDLVRVHVRGTVYAAGARIHGDLRADEAQIAGNLDVRGAQIDGDVRADKAQIGGDLRADKAQIAGLLVLNKAHIGGGVHAHGARIVGSLIVNRAHIGGAVDASGAKIAGALTYRDGLIEGGIVMPDVMHGNLGRAIAQCDGYILWHGKNGRYWAACRGPFTREEALAHWYRDDKRARVFRRAILASSLETSREAIS